MSRIALLVSQMLRYFIHILGDPINHINHSVDIWAFQFSPGIYVVTYHQSLYQQDEVGPGELDQLFIYSFSKDLSSS